jgi:hypothetical protein
VLRAGLELTVAIAGIMDCGSGAGQRRDGTRPQKSGLVQSINQTVFVGVF